MGNLVYYKAILQNMKSTGERGDSGSINEAVKNVGRSTSKQDEWKERKSHMDYERLCRGETRKLVRLTSAGCSNTRRLKERYLDKELLRLELLGAYNSNERAVECPGVSTSPCMFQVTYHLLYCMKLCSEVVLRSAGPRTEILCGAPVWKFIFRKHYIHY